MSGEFMSICGAPPRYCSLAAGCKALRCCNLGLQGTWQLNVEQLLSNIEVAKQQNQLFAALKAGSQAVAELQKEVRLPHTGCIENGHTGRKLDAPALRSRACCYTQPRAMCTA